MNPETALLDLSRSCYNPSAAAMAAPPRSLAATPWTMPCFFRRSLCIPGFLHTSHRLVRRHAVIVHCFLCFSSDYFQTDSIQHFFFSAHVFHVYDFRVIPQFSSCDHQSGSVLEILFFAPPFHDMKLSIGRLSSPFAFSTNLEAEHIIGERYRCKSTRLASGCRYSLSCCCKCPQIFTPWKRGKTPISLCKLEMS